MAALEALGDVTKFLLVLVGTVVAVALLLSGPVGWFVLVVGAVVLRAFAGAFQATGDGPWTATDNCPGCGTPVETEGAYCSDCRASAGGAGTPDVVEGSHRR